MWLQQQQQLRLRRLQARERERAPPPAVLRILTRPKRGGADGAPTAIDFTFALLAECFHLPLEQAAARFGLGCTAFKHVCRRFHLERWPYKLLARQQRADMRARRPPCDDCDDCDSCHDCDSGGDSGGGSGSGSGSGSGGSRGDDAWLDELLLLQELLPGAVPFEEPFDSEPSSAVPLQ